jgi:Uma2 family endonuclease
MPNDDRRHELVRGELRTMTPAGFEHGDVSARLVMNLGHHVEAKELGIVVEGQTGFLLASNPDTVRCPDAGFVSRERLEAHAITKGFWPGAPDLAAEVVSPNDSFTEVHEKVRAWLDAGTRMVLVLDPDERNVTVYRSRDHARTFGPDDVIDGEDVVPGWRCEVRKLFRG